MKSLLKDMARPLYHYSKNKNKREFNKLHDKWEKYPRFKMLYGVKFLDYTFDVPDALSFIWQFNELFVDELYGFNNKDDNIVIYDCGANIGMSCLFFKEIYPNAIIKAFEADSKIAKLCENNLKQNGIHDVEVINSAVWIDNNGLTFSSEGADGGSIKGENNLEQIKSFRLKEYLEAEIKIDMLKIDIEGAEYEVLKDCKNSLGNVQNLFVEYHSWNNEVQKLGEILEIFEESGFRYYIENLTNRKHPFINHGENGNMDLQLNIFGIRR